MRLTDDRRQEFVLWSDALGLSMLVNEVAHPKPEGATESTVLGPPWADGSPDLEYAKAIFTSADGEPAWVHGRRSHGSERPYSPSEPALISLAAPRTMSQRGRTIKAHLALSSLGARLPEASADRHGS